MRNVIFVVTTAVPALGVLGAGPAIARASGALGDAPSLRAEVGALMAKATGPTTDDLLRATILAGAAVRLAPREPWGYAAHCDIATQWGDATMIESCLADLRRVAPAHDETKRAAAALAALSPGTARSVGLALAWAALALACLGTLGHAFARWLRARARRASRAAVVLLATVMMLGIGTARAVNPSPLPSPLPSPQATPQATPPARFTIDDANPEAGVPAPAAQNQAPLDFAYYLQDLIERAATATGRRDHEAAIKYYRALAKAVPDRSTAWSKLCASYEAAGDPTKALLACRQALGLGGVVTGDYARFVHLILAQKGDEKGELPPKDIEDVKEVVKHLAKNQETRLAAHHLECELGLRLSDVGVLSSCTRALATLAPDDGRTISFQWALAMQKGDNDGAADLVNRARLAGVAPDGIERMERATADLAPWRARLLDWRVLLAAGAFCLTGGVAFVVARRRREPRQTPA